MSWGVVGLYVVNTDIIQTYDMDLLYQRVIREGICMSSLTVEFLLR